MWRKSITGVHVTATVFTVEFGPDESRTLTRDQSRPEVRFELYEGLPPTRLYFAGRPGEVSFKGIKRNSALLFIDAQQVFALVEDYDPTSPFSGVLSSIISVPLNGYREIVVYWDSRVWLYRLACTKL